MAARGRQTDLSNLRARSVTRKKRYHSEVNEDVEMKDAAVSKSMTRSKSRAQSVVRDRSVMGLRNVKQKTEADVLKKKVQKKSNLLAKRGESDRQILTKMPKHLFAGKRGFQADRR
jgi:nucleolar GTP-binding protein